MISEPVKRSIEMMNLYGVKNILEIGCGKGGILAQFHAPVRIGVDHFEPFIVEGKKNYRDIVFIKHDVYNLREIFQPQTFDAVIGFDILEHLEESRMINLIQLAEYLSRTLIIFFSPLDEAGFQKWQEPIEGNDSMIHKTIIRESYLKDSGYMTTVYQNYHGAGVHAMLAIKEL